MTAVIRRAEAVLQALIMMRSSIRPSLMSPGAVLCKMKTTRIRQIGNWREKGHEAYHPRLGHLGYEFASAFKSKVDFGSYHIPLANSNRSLVVRILQNKHFGLKEEPVQLTALSQSGSDLPIQFEACKND